MAGLDADTSSYPKPGAPQSPLGLASQLGSMQSQALQINQQKLDQAEQATQYLTKEMTTIGPNGRPEDYLRVAADVAKTHNLPPAAVSVFLQRMNTYKTPDGKFNSNGFFNDMMSHGANYQERINMYRGQPLPTATAQGTSINQIPGATPGQGPGSGSQPANRAFIPHGIAPSQPVYGEDNRPRLFGNQPQPGPVFTSETGTSNERLPPLANPLIAALRNAPQRNQPGAPSTYSSGRLGQGSPTEPIAPGTGGANGLGGVGPVTGVGPDYEPGLKQLSEDRAATSRTLSAIKPALQAFPLLKDLTTGTGTEKVNTVLAGLSNLGWLPKDVTDKVAAYQIVNKKLADYLSTNPISQRSDAALAIRQHASPDPKGQINSALVKLVPDAVALDRARALASIAFTDARGNVRTDANNYPHHAATFPPKIDERALKLDFMDKDARNKLIDEMEKKKNTPEGKKFMYTYELAEKNGLFER